MRSASMHNESMNAVRRLFDECGDRFGLRHVDGMAAGDFGDGRAGALGHHALRGGGIMRSSVATRY